MRIKTRHDQPSCTAALSNEDTRRKGFRFAQPTRSPRWITEVNFGHVCTRRLAGHTGDDSVLDIVTSRACSERGSSAHCKVYLGCLGNVPCQCIGQSNSQPATRQRHCPSSETQRAISSYDSFSARNSEEYHSDFALPLSRDQTDALAHRCARSPCIVSARTPRRIQSRQGYCSI